MGNVVNSIIWRKEQATWSFSEGSVHGTDIALRIKIRFKAEIRIYIPVSVQYRREI